MITLDTNALVRYLTGDDPVQERASTALIEGLSVEEPGFICREVMLEVVWVLARSYRFSRDQIAPVVEALASTDGLTVESAGDVVQAMSRYRRREAGFSDLMILAAAQRASATPVFTFDREFAGLDGVVLIPTSM